mgnify:CR=1 FL=1
MKVLIVGGGGREHAIAWKISQSPKVEKLYCAPGNAGIAKVAECVDIGVMDFEKLVAFAGEQAIDLVVVGPDDPLAAVLWTHLKMRASVCSAPGKMLPYWKLPRHFPRI